MPNQHTWKSLEVRYSSTGEFEWANPTSRPWETEMDQTSCSTTLQDEKSLQPILDHLVACFPPVDEPSYVGSDTSVSKAIKPSDPDNTTPDTFNAEIQNAYHLLFREHKLPIPGVCLCDPERCTCLPLTSSSSESTEFPFFSEKLEHLSSFLAQQTISEQPSSTSSNPITSEMPGSFPQEVDETRTIYWACKCNLRFRTPGQLNQHVNRKHIRRFKCAECNKNFNLRADLIRHAKTVHKAGGIGIADDETIDLKCPNAGCKSWEKVWDRRDNLVRHIGRCRKAIQKKEKIMMAVG
ncbi:hypothetical protein CC86DRAFT_452908 [Ophiobolus disseminans]|uniref:C2H2-type domain-containing protein n=1 Tax=Ophiobolus disseminans TaxID=1469910 RepID=A0A6A7ACT9_9PLEO|nr:hypothetical protein CC86DRAFT_452908 [Ophiobolus disseminans]